MDNIYCGLCRRNFKKMDTYFNHIEKKHSNDCDCDKKGGSKKKIKIAKVEKSKKPLTKKEMQLVFNNAKKNIDNTLGQIELNTIRYGLDIDFDKKEINKIPKELQNKIRTVVMENEYLKGMLMSQENQIKLMKKQMDNCIKNLGVHYSIYKK